MLYRIFKSIKNSYEQHQNYFLVSANDITKKNLKYLRISSITATILMLLFFAFTPLMFPTWTVSKWYGLYFVFNCIYILISQTYGRVKPKNRTVTIMCVVFWCATLVFLGIIDSSLVPSEPANFFPIIFIVLPIVFIFRYRNILIFCSLTEIFGLIMISINKYGSVRQNDLFNLLISFIVTLTVSFIILQLRIEENCSKMRYKELSKIDYLTSIYNKNTCEGVATDYLLKRAPDIVSALIIMDIDNFKMVNDKYGHSMGDRILEDFSHCLMEVFSTKDIIGRIGGDEFMVLLTDIPEESIVPIKCRELQNRLKRIQYIEGYTVNCSIGAAIVNNYKCGYFQLFKLADNALYDAKNSGKNRFVLSHMDSNNSDEIKPSIALIYADDHERAKIHKVLCKSFDINDAKNDDEALNVLQFLKDRVSGVILDFDSRKINSFGVLNYIKSNESSADIPIVAIMSEENYDEQILKHGVTEIITRPLDEHLLDDKVQNLLLNKIKK